MFRFEITTYPTIPAPPPPKPEPIPSGIDEKLLKFLKKYKFSWRINMLAMPRHRQSKYYRPPSEILMSAKDSKVVMLDKELEFRNDHLARKPLRYLMITRRENQSLGKRFIKVMDHHIENTWNSIYNYYNKILRTRKMKRVALRAKKLAEKKLKKRELNKKRKLEATERLSKPKLVPKPPRQPRKIKPLEEMLGNILKLALPKEYLIVPPKDPTAVNPAALTYEITEVIMKLTKEPKRYGNLPLPPLEPGAVQSSALKATITPRLEELARPVVNAQKRQTDEKEDPWSINPYALKYKATPRILELAKAVERD